MLLRAATGWSGVRWRPAVCADARDRESQGSSRLPGRYRGRVLPGSREAGPRSRRGMRRATSMSARTRCPALETQSCLCSRHSESLSEEHITKRDRGRKSSTAGCRRTGDGRPADHGPPRCTHRCAAKRTASHVHTSFLRAPSALPAYLKRAGPSPRRERPLPVEVERSQVSCIMLCWAGLLSSSELVQAPECRASSARHASWAHISHGSMIRVPSWGGDEPAALELRSPDPMANPYLAQRWRWRQRDGWHPAWR